MLFYKIFIIFEITIDGLFEPQKANFLSSENSYQLAHSSNRSAL